MTDRGKDKDKKNVFHADLTAEEEPDEELDEGKGASAPSVLRRLFGFGRGSDSDEGARAAADFNAKRKA
ncbi:MAG: hypothetical protein ABSB75_08790, partial [Candidatus Limnocylindrales bacterium]